MRGRGRENPEINVDLFEVKAELPNWIVWEA